MLRPRISIPRDRFSSHFNGLKSQVYHDPAIASRSVAPQGGIRSIAWNPLGNLVATGSSDKTVRVWNPDKPHVRFSTELKGHLGPIEKVAFSPSKDSELASMSSDGVVRLWDARSKTCFNEVKGLGEAVTLAWAPDGETMMVGNKAGTLFILSPRQPTPLASRPQESQVNHVAFCFSGEKVFVALETGKVRILSYPDLEPLLYTAYGLPGDGDGGDGGEGGDAGNGKEFMLDGHTWSCLSAEMQPTARYLATGGADSLIALWDTTDWLCLRTSTAMVGPVCSISFTFDGIYLVGGSNEGTGLDVVHVETGELVHTFKTAGPSPVVAWAPTRYWLAYSDSGVLRIAGMDDRK